MTNRRSTRRSTHPDCCPTNQGHRRARLTLSQMPLPMLAVPKVGQKPLPLLLTMYWWQPW